MVPLPGAPAASTYPAERDPILLEDDGRDEGHLVPQEGVTALGAPGEEPWSRKDGHQSDGPELSRPLLGSIHLPSGTSMKPVAPRAQNTQDPAAKPCTLLVAVMAALRPLASEPRMGQGHLCNNVLP